MTNHPLGLINEPGIWPIIAKHAKECFEDAACHVPDLPSDGKYAMVHVSSKEETMCEEKPSTLRWSLILNTDSSLLQDFPQHLVDIYRCMDNNTTVAVFINLKGANRSEYWAVRLFHRKEKSNMI